MQMTVLDVRGAVNCKAQSKSAIRWPSWLEPQRTIHRMGFLASRPILSWG